MSETPNPVASTLAALRRARTLLHDLDQSRRESDTTQAVNGVRHEVDTALHELEDWLTSTIENREGVTGNRHETSRAAARRVALATGQQRHRVLTALYHDGPLTDRELQDGLKITPSSERPRRGELVRAGFVQAVLTEDGKVGTRVHDGSAWTLWEITEAGRAAIAQIGVQQALPV